MVYAVMWLFMFLLPIFTELVNVGLTASHEFHWQPVLILQLSIVNLFVAFLFHNFLAAPIFVYHRKKWIYFPVATAMLALYMILIYTYRPELPSPPPAGQPVQENVSLHQANHGILTPPPLDRHDIIAFTILTLIFGVNVGVKQYFKSREDSKRLEELEKENITQQLDYLRYQVNPHFFMNTLNNIHALVDIAPSKAKTTIVMLSKMMRYILYDGAKTQIPLRHEIDFLNNYIALMRLRYNDKVEIMAELPDNAGDVSLPPLLFIMYIENAFKHGVSYATHSCVRISLRVDEQRDRLVFNCKNNITNKAVDGPGGVGLNNARKRLDLIYGEDYTLKTSNDHKTYVVTLDIPITTASSPFITS